MADFTAAFTAGTAIAEWLDPPSGGTPTRTNPFAEHPHLRRVAALGDEIEVTATVGGVAGELDSNLDGRLFFVLFIEWPGPLPALSNPAGQSSVQRFTPTAVGHYSFKLERVDGGSVIMHVDVQ
jgi:hypothetical protein